MASVLSQGRSGPVHLTWGRPEALANQLPPSGQALATVPLRERGRVVPTGRWEPACSRDSPNGEG